MKNRQVRRAQTLSPFGVGAIIDLEGESFVAADITRWRDQGEVIREPRLEKLLRVAKFKTAPAAPDNPYSHQKTNQGIPYFRFPQWLFCSKCRRMVHWTFTQEKGEQPVCSYCPGKNKLTPMRFVMACPNGHLADIPWWKWAHFESTKKCEVPDNLEFHTRSGGSGLEFLSIYCKACEAERSLEGIASPDSLKKLNIPCPGRQPWQWNKEQKQCDAVPQVLQRGATNLTFAITASSIDIPPYSNYARFSSDHLRITNMPEFTVIKSAAGSINVDEIIKLMARNAKMAPEDVKRIVNAEIRNSTLQDTSDNVQEDDLLREEFNAFLAADEDFDIRDRFIKRNVSLADRKTQDSTRYSSATSMLVNKIDTLAQITKLREVRALRGFSRLAPIVGESEDGEANGMFSVYGEHAKKIVPQMVFADLGGLEHTERWLPAIEVFGEGIFLSLSELALQEWEKIPAVIRRASILKSRFERTRSTFLPPPTPRLLLLHTLAHLLIRQLSFECGYTLSSLRERIYAAEPDTGHAMAGILIYTAAGDSEGTLGGLVREGEADRLLSTALKALQSAEWCSSDPLCRESSGQGMDAMNLAACHACSLLPETSCTLSNRMLDRAMLFGTAEDMHIGFFSTLMNSIIEGMTGE